jgi:DNA-binding CsgD family transcriptional regulator
MTKSHGRPAENQLGSLGLTPRETEVLTWIAQGKTNYEIGVILSTSTRTICKHVERILSKLRVGNRTAAAAIALAAMVKEQASQIQKVSAQLEASKPAPQVVNNP